ncbi:EF-hand domain-containing protein [Sphingomonas elodea]|uniref:EF-hand domain-containing protein n=1 Tax=Sphingomonas elodea TaxID=179878 RepID=UPI0002630ACB|nr:EF-hand domain-containing protein [Sphingomonas elodea]
MLKRFTLAALGATLLAGAAHAGQQAPQDGPPMRPRPDPLAMADKDKDGVVTRAEMLAGVETRFKAMDADHDGKVTAEERERYTAAMRARMGGSRLRAPKDMTLADEQARAGKMFDRVDTNHDGKIDATERQAAAQRMMRLSGGPGGWRGRRGASGDMPPPPPPADGN